MLPDIAPILSGNDIYRGSMAAHRDPKKQKQCCLMGHACKMIDGNAFGKYGPDFHIIRDKLLHVIQKELKENTESIVTFNDNSNRPKKQIARVWNRAMYLLGYTEDNPESKKLCLQK
jgi:hypothetical protein